MSLNNLWIFNVKIVPLSLGWRHVLPGEAAEFERGRWFSDERSARCSLVCDGSLASRLLHAVDPLWPKVSTIFI